MFILKLALAIMLPWAHADRVRILSRPPLKRACETRLPLFEHNFESTRLIQAVERFQIEALPGQLGFSVRLKNSPTGTPTRTIRIPELVHGPEDWRSENWTHDAQSYTFYNAGFTNLEDDATELNHIVGQHVRQHPHENLLIHFGPKRVEDVRTLIDLRWTPHVKVLNVYEEAKKYLSPNDLWTLMLVNQATTNYDVFVLVRNDRPFSWQATATSALENLAETIQMTYHGTRQHFTPEINGILRAAGISVDEDGDPLPFEFRILPEKLPLFRLRFYSEFDPDTTAELTRWASRFSRHVPAVVSDRVILEVMRRARAMGVKTLVMSGDPGTMRLFRRYGIRPYSELPTASDETEYLGYLRVDSPEFNEVYNRLLENSRGVRTMPVRYFE